MGVLVTRACACGTLTFANAYLFLIVLLARTVCERTLRAVCVRVRLMCISGYTQQCGVAPKAESDAVTLARAIQR